MAQILSLIRRIDGRQRLAWRRSLPTTPLVLRWLPALLSISVCGCEGDYALEPTFCDDWCHATLKPECGQPPATCVRNCEQTKAGPECFAKQQKLLACYQDTGEEGLVCVERGGGLQTRVQSGACQLQRDAMLECELPGMSICLSLCRVAQERLLQRVIASEAMGGTNFAVTLPSDSANSDLCPSLDDSCESQCWSLIGMSAGLAQIADAPVADAGAAAGGKNEGSSASSLLCIESALLACFEQAPDMQSDAGVQDAGIEGVDAGALAARPPTVNSLLAQCGGLANISTPSSSGEEEEF
ncbi:MAG TPA: hypothetical protein VHM70_24340 [Polyangiaceae bacterium]|nr:hypothetical protein [Polyangiaceae bacterium]